MNEHDELLQKVLERLKNNYFSNIKSMLSESEKVEPIILNGLNEPYLPDATAVKSGKNYIVEVETSATLTSEGKDITLKALSKYADSNGIELVVSVPVSIFMDAGKKLSQLKVDASIWDIQ
ncbi:MAG: hypothetical protein IPM56_05760 [Ignavibacteriales bacterium]|nr:MAG: hypothetical protein IPM56_05760 [Ignavibacteriales bacterium]